MRRTALALGGSIPCCCCSCA